MLNNKGFTLIELIITMVVLSVVMGLITGLVTQSMRFFGDEEKQLTNQTSLRQIAVEFEKNVRRYVIADTEYDKSGSCYIIKPIAVSQISYCYDASNFTVTRNGIIIGENIKEFSAEYNTTDHYIALFIQSRPDGYGRENKIAMKIYIRVGS